MIRKQYRVSVNIPDNIADKYHDTADYDRRSLEATKGAASAGSNNYSNLEEWAIYYDLDAAQACERRLMDMIYYFQAKELTP
jgi:hypothetical protein